MLLWLLKAGGTCLETPWISQNGTAMRAIDPWCLGSSPESAHHTSAMDLGL